MTSDPSNPFSTGGGGVNFETRIQASFLLALLVSGKIPCLLNVTPISVTFQAKRNGFETDDIVITCTDGKGTHPRLLIQIKHAISIAESDTEFSDSLLNAWDDFNNPSVFNKEHDKIAIVSGPVSAKVIAHARPLLEWARTSESADDFFKKVNAPGFSAAPKKEYLRVIRKIIDSKAPDPISDEELWQFLKRLHLLTYDFDVQGGLSEAQCLSLISSLNKAASTIEPSLIWSGLISEAQTYNQNGGVYKTEHFPASIADVMNKGKASEALAKLEEHSQLNLSLLSDELEKGFSIDRFDLLLELLDKLESHSIIMVQGMPGAGKSGLVKRFSEQLKTDFKVFTFKAQEFDESHIHTIFSKIGIDLRLDQIQAEFSLLQKKILFIDGGEKLLELHSHDAFRQLISTLSKDPSWKVIITCREYSAETLREHILAQWQADPTVLTVPLLDDVQIKAVIEKAPHLKPLFENEKIDKVLRNPFVLSIVWKSFARSGEELLKAANEHQFKDIVWKQFIENQKNLKDGFPEKRRECLLKISVERARQMKMYVKAFDCDQSALASLVADGILVKSSNGNYAPAHDIFEDWAVIRFIDGEFELHASAPLKFVEAVGAQPTMRRSFRLWMIQALAGESSEQVLEFASTVFLNGELPAFWQDEITIAVLQSDRAGEFLAKLEPLLLQDDKKLLKRIIHLLKTACKGPNQTILNMFGSRIFRKYDSMGALFSVPIGSGWREVINLINKNLDKFDFSETSLLLGLLKDWKVGVDSFKPLPPEAQAAAVICLKYWNLLTEPNTYSRGTDKEYLKILLSIPMAAKDEVEKLIQEALDGDSKKYKNREIINLVTSSFDGSALCRFIPELLIKACKEAWFEGPEPRRRYDRYGDLESSFGMRENIELRYNPSSALQGPFSFLLAFHPDLAIQFILELTNQAVESYSKSKYADEITNLDLRFKGVIKSVIASPRLWALFRGVTSSAPDILESALAALEQWLLQQITQGKDIRAILENIVEKSESVATLAVVTSVITAHYNTYGDLALPLLEHKELYCWDHERSMNDGPSNVDFRGVMGIPTRTLDDIHYDQRKNSAELPHRKITIEGLALSMQFTAYKEQVLEIIDKLKADLPKLEEQDQGDKVWRIALHRMDIRNLSAEKIEGTETFKLVSSPPAEDLQKLIDESQSSLTVNLRSYKLHNWGRATIRNEESKEFPSWREAFQEAKELSSEISPDDINTNIKESAVSYTVAVVIRDHIDEITPAELIWCEDILVKAVNKNADDQSLPNRAGKSVFEGNRPAALMLPKLFQKLDKDNISDVKKSIAIALTHSSEETSEYAATGINWYLWNGDPQFATACFNALLELASTKNQIWEKHRRADGDYEEQVKQIASAVKTTRTKLSAPTDSSQFVYQLDNIESLHSEEFKHALVLLNPHKIPEELKAVPKKLLEAFIKQAKRCEESQAHERVDFELQDKFTKFFAPYILKTTEADRAELLDILKSCIDECPEFLGKILTDIAYEEDKLQTGEVFWKLWNDMAEAIFSREKLKQNTRMYGYGALKKLVRILLFSDMEWKKGVTKWKVLEGRYPFIEAAAKAVGSTEAGFGALLSLLREVGQEFMPQALVLLSDSLKDPIEDHNILQDSNIQFDLEILLRNACYMHENVIRKNSKLHQAVISIMDALVETGSHTAFRLRDYMLSPLAPDNDNP